MHGYGKPGTIFNRLGEQLQGVPEVVGDSGGVRFKRRLPSHSENLELNVPVRISKIVTLPRLEGKP